MRPAGKMLRDLIQVFHFHLGVPILLRVEDDVGTLLASTEAHVRLDFDVGQTLSGDALFELGHELLRTARLTIDILTNETHSAHWFLLAV
jgi:hypothetical protein